MQDRPIREARFLEDFIVEVISETGSVISLNMKPCLHTTRFLPLGNEQVWKTGITDGISVIWPGVAEMSYEEITRRVFW